MSKFINYNALPGKLFIVKDKMFNHISSHCKCKKLKKECLFCKNKSLIKKLKKNNLKYKHTNLN